MNVKHLTKGTVLLSERQRDFPSRSVHSNRQRGLISVVHAAAVGEESCALSPSVG